MTTDEFKPGDFVGYIYGQPGNDTTWMIVLLCDAIHAECYDPFFQIQAAIEPKHLWHLNETELSRSIFDVKEGKSKQIGGTLREWRKMNMEVINGLFRVVIPRNDD